MDPLSTCVLFEQFLAQRRCLKNVTPSTIEWYETAFKALQRTLGGDPPLTKTSLQQFVVDLRQRRVKPVSCNTYIKAINAFCLWLRDEGHRPDLSGERTYSRAVERALEDFVRRIKARRILELAGSGLWEGDLPAMRRDRRSRKPQQVPRRAAR